MAKSAARPQEEPAKPHRSQRRTGVKLVVTLGILIVLIVAVRLVLDPGMKGNSPHPLAARDDLLRPRAGASGWYDF